MQELIVSRYQLFVVELSAPAVTDLVLVRPMT